MADKNRKNTRLPEDQESRSHSHPYQWLWEPLEKEPTLVIRSMFGGKALYLDGKLTLYCAAKEEPWRGILLCTDRGHHSSLMAQFPMLSPHPILPKWLYLSEREDCFEEIAPRLVALAGQHDPRLGVTPKPRKRIRYSTRRPAW